MSTLELVTFNALAITLALVAFVIPSPVQQIILHAIAAFARYLGA